MPFLTQGPHAKQVAGHLWPTGYGCLTRDRPEYSQQWCLSGKQSEGGVLLSSWNLSALSACMIVYFRHRTHSEIWLIAGGQGEGVKFCRETLAPWEALKKQGTWFPPDQQQKLSATPERRPSVAPCWFHKPAAAAGAETTHLLEHEQ